MATFSSFNLTHLILLESNFKREWTINLDNPEFKTTVNLDVTDAEDDNILSVYLTLNYTAGVGDLKEIMADIKMVGVFNVENLGGISKEQFSKINAPAIIFPFIREHLSSLSVKAGLNPILLQPVNFFKKVEDEKTKNTESLP